MLLRRCLTALCASLTTQLAVRAQAPTSPSAATEPPPQPVVLDRATDRSAAAVPHQHAFHLLDVSLALAAAVGGSSARDAELESLQGGGHDPRQRGFTMQQAELGLAGVVDSYCRADARIVTFLDVDGETVVELEEAYLTTLSLPAGLQLEAGHFLTHFGRVNPTHPHAWNWLDQPVVHTRVFGGDGMRAPGVQLGWHGSGERHVHVSFAVQDGEGETMRSFRANAELYDEAAVGGRLFAPAPVRSLGDFVYSLRGEVDVLATTDHALVFGASCAFGANATGGGSDTVLYGADLLWRWQASAAARTGPFVAVEAELLGREFAAAAQVDGSVPGTPVTLPAATLGDCGGFVQTFWGFTPGWAVGARVEYATGSGASYDVATQTFGRQDDPLRSDRWRVAPLLVYQASEHSRFRLQYDWDDSETLADPQHSIWLGFDLLIGAHPSHAH